MRLDVTYDPEQRPEAQHGLKQIPPSDRVDHPDLKGGLERYEAARKVEHETRLTHSQLEIERDAAAHADEVALADSQERGTKDPGAKNLEKHDRLQAEARRQHGAAKITLARAVDGVVDAFAEHGAEWEASLLEECTQIRGTMDDLLTGWERLHGDLQRNTANRAVARGNLTRDPQFYAESFKVPLVHDGDVVRVGDVLAGLRGLARPEEPKSSPTPVQHVPPAQQPHGSSQAAAHPLGAKVDPERIADWLTADEAEARQAGEAIAEERRQQRMLRAGDRKSERDAQHEADLEAAEAVR